MIASLFPEIIIPNIISKIDYNNMIEHQEHYFISDFVMEYSFFDNLLKKCDRESVANISKTLENVIFIKNDAFSSSFTTYYLDNIYLFNSNKKELYVINKNNIQYSNLNIYRSDILQNNKIETSIYDYSDNNISFRISGNSENSSVFIQPAILDRDENHDLCFVNFIKSNSTDLFFKNYLIHNEKKYFLEYDNNALTFDIHLENIKICLSYYIDEDYKNKSITISENNKEFSLILNKENNNIIIESKEISIKDFLEDSIGELLFDMKVEPYVLSFIEKDISFYDKILINHFDKFINLKSLKDFKLEDIKNFIFNLNEELLINKKINSTYIKSLK